MEMWQYSVYVFALPYSRSQPYGGHLSSEGTTLSGRSVGNFLHELFSLPIKIYPKNKTNSLLNLAPTQF